MSAVSDEVVAFVRDVAKRAGDAYWQSFGGLLAVEWGAAGIHVQSLHDLTDMSSVQKIGAAVAAAAFAAGGSTVKSLWANAGLRKQGRHVAADVVREVLPVDAQAVIAEANAIRDGVRPETKRPAKGDD